MAATLTTDSIPTIYRDENYEAFLSELPQQSTELEDQGFFDCFGSTEIEAFSTYKTHVYGSYIEESARNPGEELVPGQMGQGYNYFTAMRSEFTEVRTIETEYLATVLKLKDYAAEQGRIQAANYAQAYATYWSDLIAFGAIAPATLTATGNGSAGRHPRTRIYNHYLKGTPGAIIANLSNTDACCPDGYNWFTYYGSEHIRADGSTSASYAGKTLGFFNAGNRSGGNMRLSEANISNALIHIENDLPWGPDKKFYQAPLIDTLIVSGNLRTLATQLIDLNEYRLGTPNNDKSTVYKQSKVFGIKKIVVNRFWPDNCWVMCASGRGIKKVRFKGDFGIDGTPGPIPSSKFCVFKDLNRQIWVQQFFSYWSHWFDWDMDICWYAGSLPTSLSAGRPVAPTEASLADW